jgi:sugar O-acyltransferase (sialic acid O-acetyltransferase NeuD family)
MVTGKSKGVNVVILGAGGLARETYWVFRDSNKATARRWEVVGFIDDNRANLGKNLCGITVLGDFRWFRKANRNELKVVCAVGSPGAKRTMVERATKLGLGFCTVVHPSVQMSEHVCLGSGTVITAGCILTTQINVGNHVFLNLDTSVGHDVIIEDFVNVAPGCHISGSVTLREGTDLGTGAVVLQGITVGQWSTVGAGAVVVEDVPANAVVVGVPAKVIKYNEPGR